MPRPRATEPRRHVHLRIPESVIASVERAIEDGALGRRPKHGDVAALVTRLLREWLVRTDADATGSELSLDDLA